MSNVNIKYMKTFLKVNPEDAELDFENNKEVIEAFIETVKALEERGYDKWQIIQEFQYKFDRFVDKIRGINRSENPQCWIMANALAIRQETAELIDGLDWKHWKNSSEKINREYMLEELADILHFFVSMLISMNTDIKSTMLPEEFFASIESTLIPEIKNCKVGDKEVLRLVLLADELSSGAMDVFGFTLSLNSGCDCAEEFIDINLKRIFGYMLVINKTLGYSEDDLYYAYLKKNLKNFLRQVSPKFRGGSYYAGDRKKDAIIVIREYWYKLSL